jgi:16S rRNA (adenine1518-N6/adenine1519-N6)-dimethyltransferase
MFAKKSLGQNFLVNPHVAHRIASVANLSATATILEVGPGKGILTRELLKYGVRVVAVEKDSRLIEPLSLMFRDEIKNKYLTLVCADILNFAPSQKNIGAKSYKIVANIPYNITGSLLEYFLSAKLQPASLTLLVQKEVAERIARNKKESILSISVKAYGCPHYIATVKSGNFSPKPKVDSAIITIEQVSRKNFQNKAEESRFFSLVRAGFAHKRKFLWRNVQEFKDIRPILTALKVNHGARAEELSIEQWLEISKTLSR